jgi:hypothetical protein
VKSESEIPNPNEVPETPNEVPDNPQPIEPNDPNRPEPELE